MPKPLRVIESGQPLSARDIAHVRVSEHRKRTPWKLTPEEYARVQMATIRERRINWKLVAESNRMKRYGSEEVL